MNDTTSSVVWTVAGVLIAIQVANCYVNVCAKLGVSVMVPLRRAASALLRPLRTLRPAMRSALRSLGVLLRAIWMLPALCRACAEEERDVALKAADAGMSPEEWRRRNLEAGL